MWGWVEHLRVGGACGLGGAFKGGWSMWGWVEHVGMGGACGDGVVV